MFDHPEISTRRGTLADVEARVGALLSTLPAEAFAVGGATAAAGGRVARRPDRAEPLALVLEERPHAA